MVCYPYSIWLTLMNAASSRSGKFECPIPRAFLISSIKTPRNHSGMHPLSFPRSKLRSFQARNIWQGLVKRMLDKYGPVTSLSSIKAVADPLAGKRSVARLWRHRFILKPHRKILLVRKRRPSLFCEDIKRRSMDLQRSSQNSPSYIPIALRIQMEET